MTIEGITELLQQGEGIDVEFKTARFDLNKDTFDSICAFLNRMEYTPGGIPELIDGDVFKSLIPLRRIGVPIVQSLTTWSEVRIRLGDKLGDRLGDRLSKNEWRILEIIWENPAATISELAKEIGISTTAVENNFAKLKKKGLLERIGSNKGGYWKATFS
jgi:predicted HTH transcriptional regulator